MAIARLDPGFAGDVKKIEAALGEVAIGARAEVTAAPSGKAKAKASPDAEHALLDAAMARAKGARDIGGRTAGRNLEGRDVLRPGTSVGVVCVR